MKYLTFLIFLLLTQPIFSQTKGKNFWTEGDYKKEAVIKIPSFEKLISSIKPVVVTVTTHSSVITEGDNSQEEITIPFNNFLDKFLINKTQKGIVKQGSAFFINSEGYLLTNFHVIDEGEIIKIHLDNGNSYSADLVGADINTDLALLKVSERFSDIKVAAFGNSDNLKVGEWVIAIGNPFGLNHSVTVGIISALNREINVDQFEEFIQTDAALNVGNSGGPLFDAHGYIVGINTATTASGTGIGFSIPINLVKLVVNQLKDYGRVIRGWIGALTEFVSLQNKSALAIRETRALKVINLIKKSPAEKAGLKKGDLIYQLNNESIPSQKAFSRFITTSKIGTAVHLNILRNNKKISLKVVTEEYLDTDQKDSTPQIKEESVQLPLKEEPPEINKGLKLSEMTEELALENNIIFEEGLVIINLPDNHPWVKKLKRLDVIKEIRHPMLKEMITLKSEKEFWEIFSRFKKGDSFALKIKRGVEFIYIPLVK